ncbi:MAG: response regulator [Candidatus Thiodiazotropha sp.]
MGYEVDVEREFQSALMRLAYASKAGIGYEAVVLGSPEPDIPGLKKLQRRLNRPPHTTLPVLTLAHDQEDSITQWVENRPHTAFLLWADYRKSAAVLNQLLSKSPMGSHSQADASPLVQPIRVLFVDDSRTVRVLYRRLLTVNGYQTDTAACVREGMQKALENEYDIAIIDYFMPDGTGDMLCRQLRDNPKTAQTTTAVITGTYNDKAIQQVLEAGAVECMFKNESDDLFLTRIDAMSRHIRAHKSILNRSVTASTGWIPTGASRSSTRPAGAFSATRPKSG